MAARCGRSYQDPFNFCVNTTKTYEDEGNCFRSELPKAAAKVGPACQEQTNTIINRCASITITWHEESSCYRLRIQQGPSFDWIVPHTDACAGLNNYGSYPEGGGCNSYGCTQGTQTQPFQCVSE